MNPWKAPSQNGFSGGLVSKKICGTQLEKMCDFIRKIWNALEEIAKINLTYIYLIPKVSSPEFVDRFRPISLCNTLYKILRVSE